MFILRCMHINSQNNADHAILNTSYANLIFDVLKNIRFHKLWYSIIYLAYSSINFNIRM